MAEHLGCRCEFEGHLGTVKFYGNVPPSSGDWFGVEWDEKRGKHNGTFEGTTYFKCGEQHGSFIRPHKVNFGITIIQALEKRYGTGCTNFEDSEMFVLGENEQKTVVEMVGFEKVHQKQSQFCKLQKACFPGMCLNGAGQLGELEKMVPNLRDLDISKNLFNCWSQVSDIVKQLPHLEILDVSDNKMEIPHDVQCYQSAFENVQMLFANRMKLDWTMVAKIFAMMVNLKELHICFNSIQGIGVIITEHTKCLKLLNLEGNEISDWHDVLKLSSIESLHTLILNDTCITKIDFPATLCHNENVGFTSLQAISLSNNNISEWDSLNNLAKLKSLNSIRFKGNPICKGMRSLDIRHELIARLKHATIINGSKVTAQERQTAELDYMKKFANKWHSSVGTAEYKEFNQSHPRYEELIKVYGEPLSSLAKKPMTTLKEKLISLHIKCPDCSEKKSFTKKLPATMTVQQLKTILQRLYKIESYNQKLAYLDSKVSRDLNLLSKLKLTYWLACYPMNYQFFVTGPRSWPGTEWRGAQSDGVHHFIFDKPREGSGGKLCIAVREMAESGRERRKSQSTLKDF
eukprot:gene13806-15251_t